MPLDHDNNYEEKEFNIELSGQVRTLAKFKVVVKSCLLIFLSEKSRVAEFKIVVRKTLNHIIPKNFLPSQQQPFAGLKPKVASL